MKRQHRGRAPAVLAAVLLVAGATLVIGALHYQQHPPQPPAAAAVPTTATAKTQSPSAGGRAATRPTGLVLTASRPIRLDIPAIGVHSDLLQLGLNPDQSVQVPPLSRDSKAGWYRYSPTPGQRGPSVLLGHVDSARYGPGVFFELGALRPGDQVSVTRADHRVAVFRVDRVVSYPKDHFPTLAVYGNTSNAALRLITCGGRFDFSTRNYQSNIVAYASLVTSHPA